MNTEGEQQNSSFLVCYMLNVTEKDNRLATDVLATPDKVSVIIVCSN
jgi:hypothetical protein